MAPGGAEGFGLNYFRDWCMKTVESGMTACLNVKEISAPARIARRGGFRLGRPDSQKFETD